MFELYVSLGDSMSIDDYAGPGLGAASLLHQNSAGRWPEFQGQDLTTANPDCRFLPLARNGGMLRHVRERVGGLEPYAGPTLVTVTVGGNDLLNASRNWSIPEFGLELGGVCDRLHVLYPLLTLVLGNVYDPSEGTGVVQSGHDAFAAKLARLAELNEQLGAVAALHGARLVDIHGHFRGHAIGADEWIFCDIEPTQRGSSEIRRLWLQAL